MNVSERFVISIMVSDRPGVMRDITSPITDMGANIDDISQTVVEGYFSVILTTTFTQPRTPEEIRSAIESNFKQNEPAIIIRACDDMPEPLTVKNGDRYILAVTGKDKPGILKATTTFLAERSINIEDWTCGFEEGDVSYIGLITVPTGIDVKQMQNDLKRLLADTGMNASIRHENIFRATNEVGPIKSLLS